MPKCVHHTHRTVITCTFADVTVTNTSAPNSVITPVNNLTDKIARRHWGLSSLRDITNGGEAIVSLTTHEFLRLLAPHGMASNVMRPVWGMSEMRGGVVHLTLRGDDETTGVATIDSRILDGALALFLKPTPGHPTFAEIGVPVQGTALRIVDGTGEILPEDHIGHCRSAVSRRWSDTITTQRPIRNHSPQTAGSSPAIWTSCMRTGW